MFGNMSSSYNRLSAFIFHDSTRIHSVGTLDNNNGPASSSIHSAWGTGSGNGTNKYPVSFKFPYLNSSGQYVSISSGDTISLQICNPHVTTFKIFKPSIFVHDMRGFSDSHDFVEF